MADYQLITPWQAETWLPDGDLNTPYASLLINGSTVTENRTPSQDDLAAADQYFLGGHEYTVDQATADILIAAGYSDYLSVIP